MSITDMLPSSRFSTIAGSIFLAGILIYGAYVITHPSQTPASVAVSQSTNPDWKKALEDIQSQSPLNQLPPAPSESSVNTLLDAATSDNVTDTVARTLLINLSNAKAQGLGSDIPTQDELIADAAAKISQERGVAVYAQTDLTLIPDSKPILRSYGNSVMLILQNHPKANMTRTLYLISTAGETGDASTLNELGSIGAEYKALAKDLAALPVPQTLSPLHLSVINDFARMGATFSDMQTILTDPLRGLGGLQLYQSLSGETSRVFTSIATIFSKNGILFNKDEPGVTWNSLVP